MKVSPCCPPEKPASLCTLYLLVLCFFSFHSFSALLGMTSQGWDEADHGVEGKIERCIPGQVAQLVGALSRCTKVVGSIPGWGAYKNQLVNA